MTLLCVKMFHYNKVESAKLLVYAPYPSLTLTLRALRACACLRPFTLINKHFTRLFCLVLCCFNWKARYLCFVCGLKLTLTPSLSFLLSYHIKLFYMFFFFLYFKPLVATLFIQIIWNNIFAFSVLFLF